MIDIYTSSLDLHSKLHGKISQENKITAKDNDDLKLLYSPGVGAPCLEIQKDISKMYDYTWKSNTVAVISDGSAVLGLGNIGAGASLPVMEGKALLIKQFGGVNAIPIVLDTQDSDEIIDIITKLALGFGGIHLEDISAPRCFYIEDQLSKKLDMPVFHDDQHGTAIVVLAGLLNSLKLVQKDLQNVRVVLSGAGAAGFRIAELLHYAGFPDIVTLDSRGAIYMNRGNLDVHKQTLASYNIHNIQGNLGDVIVGADIFIGVSKPDILTAEMVSSMSDHPIIFALANPDPEISPSLAKSSGAYIVATGRSDYPNQINNLLVFPGLRRGLLENNIRQVDIDIKLRLSHIIANLVLDTELDPNHIIPDIWYPDLSRIISAHILS